jgi:hypothetical protein
MAIKNIRNVVIASGQTLSDVLTLRPTEIITALEVPSTFTQAPITFQTTIQNDVTELKNLYLDGIEYAVSGIASTVQNINPATLLSTKQVRLRSGANGATVAQTGTRTLVLVTSEL